MTGRFETKTIRRVAGNGTLEAIGLEWTEESSLRFNGRPLMWMAAIIAGVMALAAAAYVPMFGLPLLLVAAGAGGTVWYCFRWMYGALPRRSVLFARDGTILTPHGVPGHGGISRLNLQQPDLGNIEVGPSRSGMQQDWTSTVKLVSLAGGTDTISQKLHREEAREIIVGLSLALKEMRLSVGRAPVVPIRQERMARPLVD